MNFQVTQVISDYIELKQSLNNIQDIKYLGKKNFTHTQTLSHTLLDYRKALNVHQKALLI